MTAMMAELRTILLADGTLISVRPIRPSDHAALQRFHERLGERSIYQRFF